jgi:hypothetical protein
MRLLFPLWKNPGILPGFIAVCTKVGAAEFSVLFFDHSLNFFVQLAQSTAHRELNKTG